VKKTVLIRYIGVANMSGLVDSAIAAMSGASRRTEIAAINIANVSTPGFKRLMRAAPTDLPNSFDNALSRVRADLSAGKTMETGRPLDLSINGAGYFQLRAGESIMYSRQGGFTIAADGTLVTTQGYALQQAGGGDLIVSGGSATILADGAVMDGDRPVGKIAVYQPSGSAAAQALDGSLFSMAAGGVDEVATTSIRSGALEASNVSLGNEMTSTMAAMREAETGAKLIQLYDDLMGKAIQTFGQAR
jgi:flagellar basal-body rod protein FlgG